MAETITTTGTGGFGYSTYCANRLPCGVCRIMKCNCPVFDGCGVYPVPTWDTTPVPTWKQNEVTCNDTVGYHVGKGTDLDLEASDG